MSSSLKGDGYVALWSAAWTSGLFDQMALTCVCMGRSLLQEGIGCLMRHCVGHLFKPWFTALWGKLTKSGKDRSIVYWEYLL